MSNVGFSNRRFRRLKKVLEKNLVSFYFIQEGSKSYDEDGLPQSSIGERVKKQGCIQPIATKLVQIESGRYTMDDRAIYTTAILNEGDVIEYKGNRYTIDGEDDWSEYVGFRKYFAKKER